MRIVVETKEHTFDSHRQAYRWGKFTGRALGHVKAWKQVIKLFQRFYKDPSANPTVEEVMKS